MKALSKTSYLLVFSFLMLATASCNKERRFSNWLTEGSGEWTGGSSVENYISYQNNDSTSVEYFGNPELSAFTFPDDGTLTYSIFSDSLGIAFLGTGIYELRGARFLYGQVDAAANGGSVVTAMDGFQLRKSSMQVDVRIEFRDSTNELDSAVEMEVILEQN